MSIELRLTDVNPPEEEPHRTIYHDLTNLPNPVIQGITIRYFNYDDVGLYMQITGSGAGYTFGTVNLGLLATGANAYYNLDNFASRAKPAGEVTETITLALKAYTDSGYTDLKWTFDRIVTVIFINSSDPLYTTDVLNNFDDGTVQGWTATNETNNDTGWPTVAVVTDYVLSTPYSLRMTQACSPPYSPSIEVRARLNKTLTTPNKSLVYAILDLRVHEDLSLWARKYLKLTHNSTILIFIGKLAVSGTTDDYPADKWIRIVVPLPANTTLTLKVIQSYWLKWTGAGGPRDYSYLWLDDFKIISK